MRLVHHTLTSEPGVLCLVPVEHAQTIWQALQHDGQSWGVTLVGQEALNIARIEAGLPWWGVDLDESVLLPETGLEKILTSDTKGCYIGQEIVARVDTYGSVNKKLVGLLVEGDTTPATNDAVMREQESVGRITSACFSLALKRPIALGYVKRGSYEPGTRVEILHGETHLTATVTTRPFVPPS